MKDGGDQPHHEKVLPLVLGRPADRLDREPGDRHADIDKAPVVQIGLHVIRIVKQHAAFAQRMDVIAVRVIVKGDQEIRFVTRGEHFARADPDLENRRPARDGARDRHIRHHLLRAAPGQPRQHRAGALDAILRIARQPDHGIADILRRKIGFAGGGESYAETRGRAKLGKCSQTVGENCVCRAIANPTPDVNPFASQTL